MFLQASDLLPAVAEFARVSCGYPGAGPCFGAWLYLSERSSWFCSYWTPRGPPGCPVAAMSSLKAIQSVLQASRAGGGRGHICLRREPGRWPLFLPLDREPEGWAPRAPRGIGQWWMEQLARLSCGHRKCLTQLGVCRLFCLLLGHAGHRPSGTGVREGL